MKDFRELRKQMSKMISESPDPEIDYLYYKETVSHLGQFFTTFEKMVADFDAFEVGSSVSSSENFQLKDLSKKTYQEFHVLKDHIKQLRRLIEIEMAKKIKQNPELKKLERGKNEIN